MRLGFLGVLSGFFAAVFAVATPSTADAFCGFYVSGADAKLYNNATQVVMMREGRGTVLSMRNNYQGPPEGFAMVIPVPVVLQEDNVKTLPDEVFARVDKLTAPRLVEYWEQDPCAPIERWEDELPTAVENSAAIPDVPSPTPKDLGVTIEAQFDVGEYNIVILSAKDSTGLETWLTQEKYAIPAGAGPHLRPYVESGSKFFVAKVDTSKVTFKDGQAMLSPLRFHYDTDDFNLPVRLGLMNSAGTQDLLVYLLAQGQRYETANYPNVTIPTNINVKDGVRKSFGEFYAALFDSTLEKNPKAVVTEYAWDAGSCDPCPEPALNAIELATLGADVLGEKGASHNPRDFVLTRLHARYSEKTLGEDLIFKAAAPIVGGREFMGEGGVLERDSRAAGTNNFQGRYAIRHEWEGTIECASPRRGVWGGPPSGNHSKPQPATDLAFAARGGMQLANVIAQDIPAIGVVAAKPVADKAGASESAVKETGKEAGEETGKEKNKSKGCTSSGASGFGFAIAVFGLLLLCRRKEDELC
tara:strand:- start:57401 stop:58987 length:1587 start_codon:yes stop_codon:yes gene_type:complete